jgi:hypothetical protein
MAIADLSNSARRFMFNHPRPLGLFIALNGVVMGYGAIIQPIQQANAGASEIRISLRGGTIGIVLTLIGLGLVIFGKRVVRIICTNTYDSKVLVYLIGGLSGIVSIVYLMLQSYIVSKGYVFKN